jgi:hypothetical protein
MTQRTDDQKDTSSFQTADRRIGALLQKMKRQGVCGCCAGRALLRNAVMLCEETMGSAEASEMCEKFAAIMRENDFPAEHPTGHRGRPH